MPNTLTMSAPESLLLEGVSWETYCSLADELTNRMWLTYDRGQLEVMSPSQRHEEWTLLVHHMIVEACVARRVPIRAAGSMTMRTARHEKGMEPDACYWVQSESAVRGRMDLDFDVDPVPDLVLETEVSRTILPRLEILASLGIHEVWRCGTELVILQLAESGIYVESRSSGCFPWLPIDDFSAQIPAPSVAMVSFLRGFRSWVAENLDAGDASSDTVG